MIGRLENQNVWQLARQGAPATSQPSAGCRRRLQPGSARFWFAGAAWLCWFAVGPSLARGEEAKSGIAAYVHSLAQVQAALKAGNAAEAAQLLEATEAQHRSFEYHYLQARVQAAGANPAAPNLIHKLARPQGVEARYGVLNPVNRQLVFICRDGSLRIYDLTAPQNEPKQVEHSAKAAIWTGVFSHDGKTFFSGHQNGDVLVWDAATWELRRTVPIDADWPVRELDVAPDGSAFVAEGKQELQLWSLAEDEPKRIATVGPRYNFGEGLAFSPQGDLLATGGMFDILLYSAKTGEALGAMSHASYTMGLEFSPDGKRIASAPRGNVNKFLGVFDIAGKNALFNAGPFGHYVAGLAFTPDGKRIVATGCENLLRLFDATTGQIVLTWDRPECGAIPGVTQDGRLVGWSEPAGYMYIDLDSKEKPHAAEKAEVPVP